MKKQLSTFTIAATYVGTVVGAGFASGQEVLQFFGYFGIWGLIGITLSTALFIFFGISILRLGNKLQAKSHLPVINEVGGRWIGKVIDGIITLFLFGALVAMAAGSGAIFVEQFKLPFLWGSMLMVGLTLITVLMGISRVIESISLIAPVLLAFVLALSLWTVLSNPQAFVNNLAWSDPTRAAVPYWPAAAMLYSSYNLVVAVAVLAPLGMLSNPANLRSGAILGGLGLGIGVFAITASMLTRVPQITNLEVPMIAIAGGISAWARTAYSIVLFAEVYTTAIASLYGFASRITDPDGKTYKWLCIGTSIAAFFSAQFGFSNIVSTLFPAVGFAGLLLLGTLTYDYIRTYNFKILQPAPAAKLLPENRSKNNGTDKDKL